MAVDIKVHIEGLEEFKARLKRYPQIAAPEFEKAIKTSIMNLKTDTYMRTPHDTNRMRGGVQTNFGKLRGELNYDHVSYAVKQHETLSFRHPRGGEAKFLEKTIKADESKINQNFKDALGNVLNKLAK
jgi:hypothetical protein